jgi:hypothetical protein
VPPTVFHVTHWKAGSQWVRAVLESAAPDRVVDKEKCWPPNSRADGGIYSPIFASYGQFRAQVPQEDGARVFAVIRDPRDTLVSWYFSLMYSHSETDSTITESRKILSGLQKVDGLAVVTCKHLYDVINIQREWLASGERIFRYEDLVADQHGEFGRMLDYCEIDLSERRRRKIIARQSFVRRTWWRFGRENVKSHLRKGSPGDWKNHFCPRLKKLFKIHHADALIRAGYEKDDAW